MGASESSVKRWVDDGRIEAARTAGGHRRVSVAEAIRFIRESEVDLVRPEALGLAEVGGLSVAGSRSGDEVGTLHRLLLEGKAAEARAFVLSLYLYGRSVAWIVDGPMRASMERLGELWRTGPEGIFQEHRATDVAIQALNALRAILPRPTTSRWALGGAAEKDPYLLPSLAVAALLESEGWHTVNLGPRTPSAVLRAAADGVLPSIVWLSVSVTDDAGALARELSELRRWLGERRAMLVVGGKAVESLDLPAGPNLFVGRTMAELEAFVRGARLAG